MQENRDAVTTASKSQIILTEMRKEFAENMMIKQHTILQKVLEMKQRKNQAEAAKGGLVISVTSIAENEIKFFDSSLFIP